MLDSIKNAIAANSHIMLTGEYGTGKTQLVKRACSELNKKSITVHFSVFDFSSKLPGIPSDMDWVINQAKEDNAVIILEIDNMLVSGVKSVFILECMMHCQCIVVRRENEFVFPATIVDRIQEFFNLPSVMDASSTD